jgi:hypothetical protein
MSYSRSSAFLLFSLLDSRYDVCGQQFWRIGLWAKTSNGRAMLLEVKRTIANPARGNGSVRCRAPNCAAGTRKKGLHRPILTQT